MKDKLDLLFIKISNKLKQGLPLSEEEIKWIVSINRFRKKFLG